VTPRSAFKTLPFALAAAAALTATSPALAHHSFAMFDMNTEKAVSGTVTEYLWANPHTWIWIEAPSGEKWGVEGTSPYFLQGHGWSKDTLKVGDKITVTIHPNKDGGHGGAFISMTLPNGRVMDREGVQAASNAGGGGPVAARPTTAR
jgi:hypothetical protein